MCFFWDIREICMSKCTRVYAQCHHAFFQIFKYHKHASLALVPCIIKKKKTRSIICWMCAEPGVGLWSDFKKCAWVTFLKTKIHSISMFNALWIENIFFVGKSTCLHMRKHINEMFSNELCLSLNKNQIGNLKSFKLKSSITILSENETVFFFFFLMDIVFACIFEIKLARNNNCLIFYLSSPSKLIDSLWCTIKILVLKAFDFEHCIYKRPVQRIVISYPVKYINIMFEKCMPSVVVFFFG